VKCLNFTLTSSLAHTGSLLLDQKRDTPLTVAAENGRNDAVRALIALGADVNKPLKDMAASTPLMVAAKKNRASSIDALIEGLAAIDKVDKQVSSADSLLLCLRFR
jgi:ankyrin repeat protein